MFAEIGETVFEANTLHLAYRPLSIERHEGDGVILARNLERNRIGGEKTVIVLSHELRPLTHRHDVLTTEGEGATMTAIEEAIALEPGNASIPSLRQPFIPKRYLDQTYLRVVGILQEPEIGSARPRSAPRPELASK